MPTWDLHAVLTVQDLRWPPLTTLMRLASAWWFKSLVMVGAGLAADVARRRPLPWGGFAGAAAYVSASLLATAGKDLTDRPRPPRADARVIAETAVPDTSAMPSGHAATAFAVAVAVGAVHPRLRVPLLAAAAVVGVSRVYLGVHYPTDVLAGGALGVAVGLAWGSVVRRASRARRTPFPDAEVPSK